MSNSFMFMKVQKNIGKQANYLFKSILDESTKIILILKKRQENRLNFQILGNIDGCSNTNLHTPTLQIYLPKGALCASLCDVNCSYETSIESIRPTSVTKT